MVRRTLPLLLAILALAPLPATGQETTVGGLGPAEWIERLDHGDWKQAEAAMADLAAHGDAALPLLRRLAMRNDAPRYRVAGVLAVIRPAEALALYLRLLDEGPEYPRFLVAAIGRLGPDAAPAIERIAPFLRSEDREESEAAAKALARIGGDAVPVLIDALGDSSFRVREGSAAALGWIEPPAVAAAPALAAALRDPWIYARGAAALALLWIEPATPGVADALLDLDLESSAWRVDARSAIRDHLPALVSDLSRVLFGPEAARRDKAAEWLFAPEAPDLAGVVPEAAKWLRGGDAERTALAACLLARADPGREGVADALATAFRYGRTAIRIQAGRALADLGEAGKVAEGPLLEGIHDPDHEVAGTAAMALARTGADREEVVPLLLAGLRGELPGLYRRDAGYALAECGEPGLAALPLLVAALAEETVWYDQHRRNPRSVKGADWPAGVIAAFGPRAVETAPAVLEASTWVHEGLPPSMQWAAENALVPMGEAAVPALTTALDGDAFPVAAAVLARLGPLARPAAERLRPHVRPDGSGPWTAVVALARAEPEKPESVRPFREALVRGVWEGWARSRILDLLVPEDAALVPVLRRALAVEDPTARYSIACTILRVAGDPEPAIDALLACLDAGECPGVPEKVVAAAGPRTAELVTRLLAFHAATGESDALLGLGAAGAAAAPALPALKHERRELASSYRRDGKDLRRVIRAIRTVR